MASLSYTFSTNITPSRNNAKATFTINYTTQSLDDSVIINISSLVVSPVIYNGDSEFKDWATRILKEDMAGDYFVLIDDVQQLKRTNPQLGTTYSYSITKSIPKSASAKTSKLVFKFGNTWSKSANIPISALATYNISYNANGGTGAPASQTKTYGQPLTLSSTKPTRANYTFQGWATSSTGGVVYNAGGSYTVNAGATLYAVWKANTYTISYNANGGTGAPASQTKMYGVPLTLSSVKPTRTGYTFQGWATSSTGGVSYSAGGNYTNNAGIILYAVWKANTYTVSYNANGGTGAPGNDVKYYDINYTISNIRPSFSGYTFKGWARSTAIAATGEVNHAPGSVYSTNAALALYAVWELTYNKPIIQNAKVDRCLANGVLDDEGLYAKVTFTWSVYRKANARYYGGSSAPYSNNSGSAVITVGSQSKTITLSAASGTESVIIGNGSYSVDSQYTGTIKLTDTQSVYSDKTTTLNIVLSTAYFPMDFNQNATALGLFMPAPDNGSGLYLGKESRMYNAGGGTDTMYRSFRTDTGYQVGFGIGGGGVNHGTYSYKLGRWQIYSDDVKTCIGTKNRYYTFDDGTLHIPGFTGKNTRIGSQNDAYSHFYTDAAEFAFNKSIAMVGNGNIGTLSYPTGHLYMKRGAIVRLNIGGSGDSKIYAYTNNDGTQDNMMFQTGGYYAIYIGSNPKCYIFNNGIDVRDTVWMNNGKWFYMQDKDGVNRAMLTSNNNNDWTVGHGSYDGNIGSVYFRGNNTYIQAKGVLSINGQDVRSQTANKVYASPNGSTGAASFRALVAADIPVLDAGKITTGSFNAARIPVLDASKITTGVFDRGRIPNILLSVKASNVKVEGAWPANRAMTCSVDLESPGSSYYFVGVYAVKITGTNSERIVSRGFDVDNMGYGNNPTINTYWVNYGAALTNANFTVSVQGLFMRTGNG